MTMIKRLTILLLYSSILNYGSIGKDPMNFKDKDIEHFWKDPAKNIPLRVPVEVRKTLYRKLQLLDAAAQISDLRAPPGNRLEKLKGARKGQYSIRVNEQWRLCFTWSNNNVEGVEFDDYH